MAIKLKTKFKQLTSINYSKLKNPMFTEFKLYLIEDKSKYITLQRQGWCELCDDNGKFLGDEFLIKIPEKNVSMEILIPEDETLIIMPTGNEIYGFEINRDI